MEGKMNIIEKGGFMNGKERVLSLLRFENSPDGRETRPLESSRARTRMKREMDKKKFEGKKGWKDQKRHQMEERRVCYCRDSEKTK